MIVLAATDDPRKAALITKTRDIVRATGSARTELALAAARGVTSLEKFISLMPFMVAEAERRFLRHASGPRPTQPRQGLRNTAPTNPTRSGSGRDSDG